MEATLAQTIAFCGQNQVLMMMRYNGNEREVEVYSYKITGKGDTLLYAYCYKDQQIESFRVDKIEHAKATKTPFNPKWEIKL